MKKINLEPQDTTCTPQTTRRRLLMTGAIGAISYQTVGLTSLTGLTGLVLPKNSSAQTSTQTSAQPPSSQSQKKPFTIGIVTFRGPSAVEEGFKSYLQQVGLTANYLQYDMARDPKRIPSILENLHNAQPDLILTWGTTVSKGIAGTLNQPNAWRPKCPIVFALVTDPVGAELVHSLTGPNPNITGIYHVATLEQQMKAMTQYRAFTSVGMLYTPTEANSILIRDQLKALLAQQGKKLIAVPFDVDPQGNPTNVGVEQKINHIKQNGAQWLYLPPDSFLGTQAKTLVLPAALQAHLPSFATTEQLMNAGALMGLVCAYFEIGQFAAFKAFNILHKHQPAGQIPVETLKTYSLRINSALAHALHMTPPIPLFGVAQFQN